jgi:hypothetical protein
VGTTANGKLPPFGHGDPNGKTVILPAEKYGKTENMENPELYTVFPYRFEMGTQFRRSEGNPVPNAVLTSPDSKPGREG